ncbi:hypothetical protein [Devosia aurantiaca]|uniref:Uncharacterized protein n=1 Tax=Devosia aurantiaca TaxID=2714858 RepID=A0A6M1SMY6_9HYPH|nr:hypothetical protein [Devosia aurantiaca]NGP18568.1 hypothetical protein [Devosia aurantiaca]
MTSNDPLQIICDLDCDFGIEQSVKLSRKTLNADRYLLSIHRDDLKVTFDEFMHRLDVPKMWRDDLNRRFEISKLIHVGHEGGTKPLRKLYLENIDGEHGTRALKRSHLMHLALKWDQTGAASFTRYWLDPNVLAQDVLKQLKSSKCIQPSVNIAEILLGLVKIKGKEVMALRVEEEGTSRRSWDFNLYRAEIGGLAIASSITDLCGRYSIDKKDQNVLLNTLIGKRLGHLSVGTNKFGEDFTTFYFGVKPGRELLRA